MKFATDRPYTDPEKAARKLVEIANAIEPAHDGRIFIETVNAPSASRGLWRLALRASPLDRASCSRTAGSRSGHPSRPGARTTPRRAPGVRSSQARALSLHEPFLFGGFRALETIPSGAGVMQISSAPCSPSFYRARVAVPFASPLAVQPASAPPKHKHFRGGIIRRPNIFRGKLTVSRQSHLIWQRSQPIKMESPCPGSPC
jgi:hypothetical protein